jgi:hypothetical protein
MRETRLGTDIRERVGSGERAEEQWQELATGERLDAPHGRSRVSAATSHVHR